MKKLNLLLIVAMLAAALVAANPPGKLVSLQIINASGDTVYMKLEGRGTGAFYYLTIPRATTKYFTVLVDSYRRTTWACGGIRSTGSLVMTGQVKLKFTACGRIPVIINAYDWNHDGLVDAVGPKPNFGEPTQEKVVFYQEYTNRYWLKSTVLFDDGVFLWLGSFWSYRKGSVAWRTARVPRGIYMKYRY